MRSGFGQLIEIVHLLKVSIGGFLRYGGTFEDFGHLLFISKALSRLRLMTLFRGF